jgi:WhiB family redox-sensing transcriptional regulator
VTGERGRGEIPPPALPSREIWREEARCRGMDPDIFFHGRRRSAARARRICAGCPVVGECLDYAISEKLWFGVWGGMTPRERRVVWRTRTTWTDQNPTPSLRDEVS